MIKAFQFSQNTLDFLKNFFFSNSLSVYFFEIQLIQRVYLEYWQQWTYNKALTLKEVFIVIICYYFNGISMYHD